MDLKTKVADVSRVYKMYSGRLARLGIFTVEGFLYHIPFRYDDFGLISKIDDIQEGEIVTIQGVVQSIKNLYARRFIIQKAKITDETGELEVTWFNQPYLTRVIGEGDRISLSGKVIQKGSRLTLQSPEYEVLEGEALHTGRLVPVYPETRGVSSKWLRRQVHKILEESLGQIKEVLPEEILLKNKLLDLKTAIFQIHFPDNYEMAQKARERLSFDEFLSIHLRSMNLKKNWEEKNLNKPIEVNKFRNKINELIRNLPFELTSAQKKTIEEIFGDLSSDKAMNRLLQGEVGSGKTVVAAIAMFLCFLNGKKSVLIAPTEILANQHFKTIKNLLESFGVKIGLFTKSSKGKIDADIFIGTHAILHRLPKLKDLSIIVIDEQQRFGVEQRGILREKGNNPNILTMTATPIPRTVALTVYGNLSLSFLNEMPRDRKKVKTWLVPDIKRENAYKWIDERIKEGDQAFIVCPFIEESETLITVKAATKEFDRLKNIFPDLNLGLLHGRTKTKEKQKIFEEFKNRKIDILVTTPIVEVGIDFPNATVMLIEEAERFGLSQLHQLRGRVGRGEKQSYCLLFTQSKNGHVLERLKAMEKLNNGAELAELDLKLRGPGEIFGTIQHGMPYLKVASFSNFELIDKTRREAREIFPKISKYKELYKRINQTDNTIVSPD